MLQLCSTMEVFMKIIDLHADIGYHIYNEKRKGNEDVFSEYHLPKLVEGDNLAVGFVSFFEGKEDLACAYEMTEFLHHQIQKYSENIVPYLKGEMDFNKINAIMTIEGMCFIKDEVIPHLDHFYELGVRIASLTWNEENNLATGAKSNPSRGLTTLGIEAVKHMNQIGMIIDVSHLNEKSFWDVLAHSTKPVIATHSNARRFANVDRNLTDQQIKALINQNGLIGLNAVRYFVSDDESLQDVYQLAKHARYIADMGGIDCLACGFDYMDYLDEPFGIHSMAKLIQSAKDNQNLVLALEKEGFNHSEIKKICHINAYNFFQKNFQ